MSIALSAFAHVMSSFHSLNIYIEVYAPNPKQGMWLRDATFWGFFYETLWNDRKWMPHDIIVGSGENGKRRALWDFRAWQDAATNDGREIRICVRTARLLDDYVDNLRGKLRTTFEPVVVEDVTWIWDDLPARTSEAPQTFFSRLAYWKEAKACAFRKYVAAKVSREESCCCSFLMTVELQDALTQQWLSYTSVQLPPH